MQIIFIIFGDEVTEDAALLMLRSRTIFSHQRKVHGEIAEFGTSAYQRKRCSRLHQQSDGSSSWSLQVLRNRSRRSKESFSAFTLTEGK